MTFEESDYWNREERYCEKRSGILLGTCCHVASNLLSCHLLFDVAVLFCYYIETNE